jgi:hypothetical protein
MPRRSFFQARPRCPVRVAHRGGGAAGHRTVSYRQLIMGLIVAPELPRAGIGTDAWRILGSRLRRARDTGLDFSRVWRRRRNSSSRYPKRGGIGAATRQQKYQKNGYCTHAPDDAARRSFCLRQPTAGRHRRNPSRGFLGLLPGSNRKVMVDGPRTLGWKC